MYSSICRRGRHAVSVTINKRLKQNKTKLIKNENRFGSLDKTTTRDLFNTPGRRRTCTGGGHL